MNQWECLVCGFLYDEAQGVVKKGIRPGTPWDKVPEEFRCPGCGVGKEDFDPKKDGGQASDQTFDD